MSDCLLDEIKSTLNPVLPSQLIIGLLLRGVLHLLMSVDCQSLGVVTLGQDEGVREVLWQSFALVHSALQT